MKMQAAKSYSFFIAHVTESQKIHLVLLGAGITVLFLLFQWHWPVEAAQMALLTLLAVLPFSLVYRAILRSPGNLETRYRKFCRAALAQGLADILIITATIHQTGGPSSPAVMFYLVFIGTASVFYSTVHLLWFDAWMLGLYGALIFGYESGLLKPVSLSAPYSVLNSLHFSPMFMIGVLLATGFIVVVQSNKVRLAWQSADQQNQYLDDLNALTHLGLVHVELSYLYETLAGEIRKILNADAIFLTRWDDSSQQVLTGAAAGSVQAQSLPAISRPEASLTAAVQRAGKELVARNAQCSPYITPHYAQNFPARSLLGLPMYGLPDRRFLGALLVAFNAIHDFTDQEVEQARQLADVAALLISRTRLYHETQYRASLLEQMAGQVSELTSDLHRTTLLPAIVEAARGLLKAQRAALHLYDRATGLLKHEYSIGLSETYLQAMAEKFLVSPEAELLREKDFVLIPDVARDQRTATRRNIIAKEKFRAYAVFALKTSQDNQGIISLYWDVPHAISSSDVSVGQLFAQRASAMLHNATLYEQVTEESLTDVLTGLPNRRYFDRRLVEECQRATRYGHSLALLMLDLDGFKAINDAFGHAIGDSVIKQVAGALLRIIRSSDMVARFGGDEFALIVPEADRSAAIHLAKKIKMMLAGTRLHLPNDTQRYLSACIGLAIFPRDSAEVQALFNLADQRMYRAKRSKQGSIICDEN